MKEWNDKNEEKNNNNKSRNEKKNENKQSSLGAFAIHRLLYFIDERNKRKMKSTNEAEKKTIVILLDAHPPSAALLSRVHLT